VIRNLFGYLPRDVRYRPWFSTPSDDLSALRGSHNRVKLDSVVATLWRAFWVIVTILAAGSAADAFGL
jgi:hypothetical protein